MATTSWISSDAPGRRGLRGFFFGDAGKLVDPGLWIDGEISRRLERCRASFDLLMGFSCRDLLSHYPLLAFTFDQMLVRICRQSTMGLVRSREWPLSECWLVSFFVARKVASVLVKTLLFILYWSVQCYQPVGCFIDLQKGRFSLVVGALSVSLVIIVLCLNCNFVFRKRAS